MELTTLQNKLNSYKNGTFVKVVWEKDVASAKAKKQGISVIKRCEGIVRAGITYANIELVKSLMSQSMEEEREHKSSWFEHVGKGIVQHKQNADKKYLQLFFVNNKKIKSTFTLMSGEKVNANDLYEQGLITKADLSKQSNEPMITMTVSIDNIVSFGK